MIFFPVSVTPRRQNNLAGVIVDHWYVLVKTLILDGPD